MVANPDEPTKPTVRGRGRPKGTIKPLREDPERYVIAYFIARMNLFKPRPEPIKLARVLMQIHHGQIASFDAFADFAAALAEDHFLHLNMQSERRGRDDPEQEYWYDQDAANARAHNFLIKVRALLKRLRNVVSSDADDAPTDQRDRYWLDLMVDAWRMALTVETWQWGGGDFWARSEKIRAAMEDLAKDNAAKARESEYFEKTIEPKFRIRVVKSLGGAIFPAS